MLAHRGNERIAARIDLAQVGHEKRPLLEDRLGDDAAAARDRGAAEMLEQVGEIDRRRREIMRLDLELPRPRRQAAGEGAVRADMLGDELEANAHRALEFGCRERRVGDVVGELEPGLGQAARGELVGEAALGGARFDFIDDQPREPLEMNRIGLGDVGPRHLVGHRERAEALATAGDQRRGRAKAQPAGLHRRDGGQPRIGSGVGDQHHAIGAKRTLAYGEFRVIGRSRPPAGGKKPDPGGRHGKETGRRPP